MADIEDMDPRKVLIVTTGSQVRMIIQDTPMIILIKFFQNKSKRKKKLEAFNRLALEAVGKISCDFNFRFMTLQAEPRAALNLASQSLSENLVIRPDDMILFSAKAIPGNEKRVQKMLNSLSNLGALIVNGRNDGLHASGHAYSGEQEEVFIIIW